MISLIRIIILLASAGIYLYFSEKLFSYIQKNKPTLFKSLITSHYMYPILRMSPLRIGQISPEVLVYYLMTTEKEDDAITKGLKRKVLIPILVFWSVFIIELFF